jgi:4-hydroxy-4-methyl-2-oxoglutarate aldolase
MPEAKAKIYREIPRADGSLIASLRGLTVADIHDALTPEARSAGLMNQSMRPVTPGLRICGQAMTAFCALGDSLMVHCALYLAQPGDVLVISSGGVPHGALWGGNVAFDAKAHGLAGTIVDAPVRDVAAIRELRYPAWASSIAVTRLEKMGQGFVNLPVACGGCLVRPGDVIVADDDGVLAFSPLFIPQIVSSVQDRARREAQVRRRIEAGERLFETQDFAKLLEDSGAEVCDGSWVAGEN